MFDNYPEEYEPSWEEMQEIEKIVNQENNTNGINYRNFDIDDGLDNFKAWLRKNGMRWD